MMNWLLLKIKNGMGLGDYATATLVLGGVATVILGIVAFVVPYHPLFWIYGAGALATFLLTTRVDPKLGVKGEITEEDVAQYLLAASFLWIGQVLLLALLGAFCLVYFFFVGLFNLHTGLRNFKISLPKRKVKTIPMEPLPNSDPYRSVPQVCESCGNMK